MSPKKIAPLRNENHCSCKKFMPPEKRNSKDAYQGPKYFTFKGELLTDLRTKLGK